MNPSHRCPCGSGVKWVTGTLWDMMEPRKPRRVPTCLVTGAYAWGEYCTNGPSPTKDTRYMCAPPAFNEDQVDMFSDSS